MANYNYVTMAQIDEAIHKAIENVGVSFELSSSNDKHICTLECLDYAPNLVYIRYSHGYTHYNMDKDSFNLARYLVLMSLNCSLKVNGKYYKLSSGRGDTVIYSNVNDCFITYDGILEF